jgi:hypothetical protein
MNWHLTEVASAVSPTMFSEFNESDVTCSVRHVMGRVQFESLWLFCPAFADVFVWREAFEGLETAAGIAGADEVVEVRLQLLTAVTVTAPDCRFLDGRFICATCPPFGEKVHWTFSLSLRLKGSLTLVFRWSCRFRRRRGQTHARRPCGPVCGS